MTLEELRKLDAAATPGPWCHVPGDLLINEVGSPVDECLIECRDSSHDAALIAAMRNALPDLIAAVELLDRFRCLANPDLHKDLCQTTDAILKRLGVE